MASTRRRILAGAVALAGATAALAGCSPDDQETPPPPPPPPDALEPLLAETRALLDLYQAAYAAQPSLASRLTPMLEAHTAHLAELTKVMTPPPSPVTAGSVPVPPSGSPTTAASVTLAELRAAEQTGQKSAATACATAPATRAALLGSIAAARATHAEVLR
ncbi:hypothetical protein [Catenuloplanes japonicus]|uniref:hypothetical protein n=1 Tax=Catenuloplanes japonicus TaxID=33876 RepID=UPI000691B249|nr:hypothetical protein [Catenuloplanes japonicus]